MNFLIVATLFIASSLAQSEYCKFCSNHVACLNRNGAWASKCPKDASLVEISDVELSELFLHYHNNYRNQIASGKPNLMPATNMKKMVIIELKLRNQALTSLGS